MNARQRNSKCDSPVTLNSGGDALLRSPNIRAAQQRRPTCTLAGFLLAAFLITVLGSPTLFAATSNPPDRISYQGFLTDNNGSPLAPSSPQNYTVVFRIWDASQGGANVWTEQQTVTVDNGVFSVLLGEGSQFQSEPRPVPLSSVFQGSTASDRYLGITVADLGNELLPRMQLLASPYAFLADQANSVNGNGGIEVINPTRVPVADSGTFNPDFGWRSIWTSQRSGQPTWNFVTDTYGGLVWANGNANDATGQYEMVLEHGGRLIVPGGGSFGSLGVTGAGTFGSLAATGAGQFGSLVVNGQSELNGLLIAGGGGEHIWRRYPQLRWFFSRTHIASVSSPPSRYWIRWKPVGVL